MYRTLAKRKINPQWLFFLCNFVFLLWDPLLSAGFDSLHWRLFSTSDGLVENWSSSVTVGSTGHVWINHGDVNSSSGYDGYQYKRIPSPGWYANLDWKIYENSSGNLWAMHPRGLQQFLDGQWKVYPIKEIQHSDWKWNFQRQNQLLPLFNNRVLILLRDHLMEFDPSRNRTRTICKANQFKVGRFIHMTGHHDHRIWISGELGLLNITYSKNQNNIHFHPKEYLLPETSEYRNLRYPYARDPSTIIVTADSLHNQNNALIQFVGNTFQPVYQNNKRAILRGWPGMDDSLWIESPDCLIQYQNQAGKKIRRNEILAGTIYDVATDKAGCFWIATSLGVARYAPPIWREPPIVNELQPPILAVHESTRNRLWFACKDSFVCLHNGQLKKYSLPEGREMHPFSQEGLCFLPDGRIAYRTEKVFPELTLFNPQTESFEFVPHPKGYYTEVIASRENGSLWIQSYHNTPPHDYDAEDFQIETFDGSQFHVVLDQKNQWDIDKLTCIYKSKNGDLWFGGLRGLGLYRKTKYRPIDQSQGYTGDGVFCIHEIQPGIVWFGGRNEIFEYTNGTFQLKKTNLHDVWSIHRRKNEEIWIATASGIHRISDKKWITNTIQDGLSNTAVYKLFEDKKNRIWARTANGMCLYHPEADRFPPKIRIPMEKNSTVFAPSSDVRIVYEGRDRWEYTPKKRLLYSYRLDNGSWSECISDPLAVFRHLPPGRHQFEVTTIDRNGNTNPTPATFQFTVLLPWYKEIGFLAILTIGSLAILALITMTILHQRKLENLVALRTTDLKKANKQLQKDIIERKQAEEERIRLEEQLRHAHKMEAIGRLAGGIAHDFNNLLTGILGNIILVEEKSPENIRTKLANARNAANRAATLVQQLLTFSRKTNVQRTILDINSIVEELFHLARQTIDRRIDIQFQKEINLPPILGDESLINSVLMNLCINARDAIDEVIQSQSSHKLKRDRFYIEIKTSIDNIHPNDLSRFSYAKEDRYVVVSITDNGIGMNMDTQQNIFEPYFTTKEVGKGTGLGLASGYGIMREHEGWIDFESQPGKGSTFRIYFPVAEEKNIPSSPPTEPPSHSPDDGKETILLVEDEEVIRNLGKSVLEKKGYTVLEAEDGMQGLSRVQEYGTQIDLIILDLSMPKLSGREFLEELSALGANIDVIISTGYIHEEQKEFFERHNVKGYVPKPYRPTNLLETVRNILNSE